MTLNVTEYIKVDCLCQKTNPEGEGKSLFCWVNSLSKITFEGQVAAVIAGGQQEEGGRGGLQ